jgi:hypothetical protein
VLGIARSINIALRAGEPYFAIDDILRFAARDGYRDSGRPDPQEVRKPWLDGLRRR